MGFQEHIQVLCMYGYPQEATHCGLYYFGIVNIYAFRRAYNMTDAKPVGSAYNSAHIARILYPVKYQYPLITEVRITGRFRYRYGE
ncbi:hypothetical protein D3C72_889430 [compost metagenome]